MSDVATDNLVLDGDIPTFVLGAGNIQMIRIYSTDGKWAGIGFNQIEAGDVGREIQSPKDPGDGRLFQIMSNSKRSLEILRMAVDLAIEKCEESEQ